MLKQSLFVAALAATSFGAQAGDRFADAHQDAAFAKAFYSFEFGGASSSTDRHRMGFVANAVGNTKALPMVEYTKTRAGETQLSISGAPVMINGQSLNAGEEAVFLGMTATTTALVATALVVTAVVVASDDDDNNPPATGGN
ncbi:MAG TPA: hypothetical protein VGE57_04765 [Solimonas sp.]